LRAGVPFYMGKVLEFNLDNGNGQEKLKLYGTGLLRERECKGGRDVVEHDMRMAWKHLGSRHWRDTAGLLRKQQYSPERMYQQEQEAGPYMRTMYGCMV
jgi:hypothetical protein